METIVLDWSALSQVVQQGETGALEQALRSTGSKFAITDHGLGDIPDEFQPDFNALKERLNIQTVIISANFAMDTKENRRLGVVFDQNAPLIGKPDEIIKQIAEYREAGVDYFILRFMGGNFSDEAELFAKRVLPYV